MEIMDASCRGWAISPREGGSRETSPGQEHGGTSIGEVT